MRSFTTALLAVAMILVLALPAAAQSYPPDTTVVAGTMVEAGSSGVASPDPAGELAFTGGQVTVGAALSVALLLAGAGAVIAARRRERRQA